MPSSKISLWRHCFKLFSPNEPNIFHFIEFSFVSHTNIFSILLPWICNIENWKLMNCRYARKREKKRESNSTIMLSFDISCINRLHYSHIKWGISCCRHYQHCLFAHFYSCSWLIIVREGAKGNLWNENGNFAYKDRKNVKTIINHRCLIKNPKLA